MISPVILITGANGFIGRNLLDELQRIHGNAFQIKIISRKKPDFDCEFLSYDNFVAQNFDKNFFLNVEIAIHLGAIAHKFSSVEAHLLCEVNDEYLKNLIKYLNPNRLKKFLFMSSYAVSLLEKNILLDTKVYAELKKNSEDYLRETCKTSFPDTLFYFLRPPMVYGLKAPGNFQSLLKLMSKRVLIPFGKLDYDRSFIHVKNLVSFMSCLIQRPDKGDSQFTIIEIADPWHETFASFCIRLSKSIKAKAIVIGFPVILLKFLLVMIGKKELFKKLTLEYQINSAAIQEHYHWIPPVKKESSFSDISG